MKGHKLDISHRYAVEGNQLLDLTEGRRVVRVEHCHHCALALCAELDKMKRDAAPNIFPTTTEIEA